MTGPRALVVVRQLSGVVWRLPRGRRCEAASAPPRPIIARARPPAAPMPASPQSKPFGGVWIRTTACGALPGVVTGIISLSGRSYTLAGGWSAVVAGVVPLTIDLSGRLYTLAGGWLAVVAGLVLLAMAVGAPAAASDKVTAAAVVVRWVMVISTASCCWSIAGCDRCGRGRLRGAGRDSVETGLDPVGTAPAGFSKRVLRW
jgi:hypothetical protein